MSLPGGAFINDFTIDTTTTNLTDQLLGRCANQCFAGSTTFSTVPYYTINTPRNVTLVYTEERAHPRPVIYADVTPTTGSATPTQYTLQATLNGTTITFLTGDTQIYFSGASAPARLAGQFDARSDTTGLYTLVVTVTATYSGGGTATHSYTRTLVIENEAHSPFGRGWTVAGWQHLYVVGSSYLITDGSGNAIYFPSLGTTAADYSVLTYDAVNLAYVRTSVDGTKAYFYRNGLLYRVINPLGFAYEYGNNTTTNRLLWITDPQRNIGGVGTTELYFTYGTYGFASISESGGAANRVTALTVASDSTLQAITDPDGVTTHFAYDASGRLSTVVDRSGDTTTYKYDSQSWKLTELDLPRIAVNSGGGTTINVTPKTKYMSWQTRGVPTVATSSIAPATPIAKSAVQATVTDPIGRVTTLTVNRWGQPLVITDPASRVMTITRSGPLPVQVAYPNGGVDIISYVTGTPLVSYRQMAGDSTVHYHYGAQNQVDSLWGPGLRSEFRFLNATTGRVDSIRYAGTPTLMRRLAYDSYNRVISVTDPGSHPTTYAYAPISGNVDSVSEPGQIYTVTRFDAFGRDSASRTTGSSLWRRTAYDTLNRVVKTWHAGTAVPDTTFLQYDPLHLVRVQTPQHQVYKYAANALGWPTTRYDSYDTTKFVSFRYDTTGRLTSWTNRRSQRIDLTYDVRDRVLTRAVNGSVTDSLGYSTNDLVITALRLNVARDSLFTDTAGLTDSIVRRMGNHRYAVKYTSTFPYAGVHRTVTLGEDTTTIFSQETDAIHDSLPARDSITLTGTHEGGTSVIYRGLEGLADSLKWPLHEHGYVRYRTQRHQIWEATEGFQYGQPAPDSLWREVTYDSLGLIISDMRDVTQQHRRLVRKFAFDSLGQLLKVQVLTDTETAACVKVADTVAFGILYSCPTLSTTTQDSATYDSVGNRLFPGASYSATGNRLLAGPSGVAYTYDADGNLATRTHSGVTDYLYWGATGLLDSVVSGTLHHRYEYNSMGQLVRRWVAVGSGSYTVDRYFLWDFTQLLGEFNGSGGLIAQYVYNGGIDQPFALVTDSGGTAKVRYMYQDPYEGSLTGVMKDSSTLEQYSQYSVWGQLSARPINVLADTNRLGWKGLMYEGDSTKLYYVRNRWYDPAVGRFVSEDPMGLAGGTNAYSFAGNDPINGTDPLGLCESGSCGGFTPTLGCGLKGDLWGDAKSLFFGGNYSCPPPVHLRQVFKQPWRKPPTPVPSLPVSPRQEAGGNTSGTGAVFYVGADGALIFGTGPTGAVGIYHVRHGESGIYARVGIGFGLGGGVNAEGGWSRSRTTFFGQGLALCGSGAIGTGCANFGQSGITGVSGGPGGKIGIYSEVSNTFPMDVPSLSEVVTSSNFWLEGLSFFQVMNGAR